MRTPVNRASTSTARSGHTEPSATPSRTPCCSSWLMKISSSSLPTGLLALAALTTVTLARVGGLDRAADPVLALVDPSPDGTAAAVRAMLLVATSAIAGIGLVAGVLSGVGVGSGSAGAGERRPVGRGALVLAWAAGLLATAG